MNKSAEAFRTISEVSGEIDVAKHVLRFWETKFSQVKPMQRGGGRRYYRPEDVDLLKGIRHLLYGDGYTIKGVQRLFREQGVEFIKNCWRDEDGNLQTDRAGQPKIPDIASETRKRAAEGPIKPTQPAKTAKKRKKTVPEKVSYLIPDAERDILIAALDELEACAEFSRSCH